MLCLSVLVVIHELGHFGLAKAFGVYVEEFSLGFGPRLFKFKRKKGETTFSIRAIPFGGYVAMPDGYDDLPDEEKEKLPCNKERTLSGIKRWKKVLIMLGGVSVNFIAALFILSTFYMSTPTKTDLSPTVYVVETSRAYNAGLRTGMTIEHLDVKGTSNGVDFEIHGDVEHSNDVFKVTNQLVETYAPYQGDTATLTFTVTDHENISVSIEPYVNPQNEEEILGWTAIGIGYNKVKTGFFESIGLGFQTFGKATTETFKALGRIITFQKDSIKEVSGPVGIYQASDYMLTAGGISYYWYLWGVVSLSFGLMNILPFPGLDGWQVVITTIEAIRRKDFKTKTKGIISMVGIGILFLLGMVVLVKDIIFIFI